MENNKKELIEKLKGGLIVSCQTQPKDVIHELSLIHISMCIRDRP